MNTIVVNKIADIQEHSGPIYKVIKQENNPRLFFTSSADKFVVQWDALNKKQNGPAVKLEQAAYEIMVCNNHLLFCGTLGGSILIVDLKQKKEIRNLKTSSCAIFSLLVVEDKNLFLAGDAQGWIYLYDYDTLTFRDKIRISNNKIRQIYYHNSVLWIAATNAPLFKFDANSLEKRAEYNVSAMGVNTICIQDNWIFTGSRDAHLRKFDTRLMDKPLCEIPLHNYAIYAIKKPERHHLLVTASRDKTIKILDENSLRVIKRIDSNTEQGHTLSVNSIEWFPELNLLVSCGDDKRIILWELKNLAIQ